MNRRMQKAKDARKHYAARHRWAVRLRAEIRNYPAATTDDHVDAIIYPQLATARAREDEFVRAGMRSGTYPGAPWPCMNCSYVNHHVTLQTGQVVVQISHTETCATCRAKGAPDRLPA